MTNGGMEQVKASLEVRFAIAESRPRDFAKAREKLLAASRRPRFADEARYSVPGGARFDRISGQWEERMIEGPSIRFAEAAAAALGNLLPETMTVAEDARSRQIRVSVTDLEGNVTYADGVKIDKLVERHHIRKGQTYLEQRTTAYGDLVFLVTADEGELQSRQANEVSRAMRRLILRLVPADLVEDCMTTCVAALRLEHERDPGASVAQIVANYAARGISAADLATYVGKPLEGIDAGEASHLRSLWTAIRDGQVAWYDALEDRMLTRPAPPAEHLDDGDEDETPVPTPTPPTPPVKGKGAKAAAAALKAERAAAAAPDPALAPPALAIVPPAKPPEEPGWMRPSLVPADDE